MNTRLLLLIASLVTSPLARVTNAQSARTHPDLNGVWVMDTLKSIRPDGLNTLAITIAASGDTLIMDAVAVTAIGPITSHQVFGVDGRPWKNSILTGQGSLDTRSVLLWKKSRLLITTTSDVQGTAFVQRDEWVVSPSRKSVKITRTIDMGGQQQTSSLVLIRR